MKQRRENENNKSRGGIDDDTIGSNGLFLMDSLDDKWRPNEPCHISIGDVTATDHTAFIS